MSEIKCTAFPESITVHQHKSGLTILVNENRELSKAYAVYATNFGSVVNHFKVGEKEICLPDGIAHFLEHKMFENEEGDAFANFGKVGGNANAFTDFDITAYLFSCTSGFQQNLEILLDFVKRPYFTNQSVAKEQGIIGQEIKMYEDHPGWRVSFNLLRALYQKNSVRIDIAGDTDSIAQITPELLYETYRAFYRPSNMVLCVSGNVGLSEVLEVADRVLEPETPAPEITRIFEQEPEAVTQSFITQSLSVAKPIFAIGYKDNDLAHGAELARRECAMEMLVNCIIGKASPLYNRLYDEGLINGSLSAGYVCSDSFAYLDIEGESDQPEKVFDAVKAEIARLRESGVPREAFERSKKLVYGRLIASANSPENIGNMMARSYFLGQRYYDRFEAAKQVQYDEMAPLLIKLEEKLAALSVITPCE